MFPQNWFCGNTKFAKITLYGQELPRSRAMMLNGKLHQRAPVGSASTHTNTKIQQHRKKSTTAAIMNGVRFVLRAGSEAKGAGLAGTLPAYSTGAGGGGVTGREEEGTAAARGETTVAPASTFITSNTRMICSPNETTSPAFSTRGPARRWPFTNVPLVEPRSSSTYLPPWNVRRAWRREISASLITMSLVASRPIVN